MIIKSAGFIAADMIGSKNALNFAYALYLRLRADDTLSEGERKRIVRRWFVMSMLTGRHSGSFESTWEQDIRRIGTLGAAAYLKQVEESELTDGFWTVALPAALETTSTASPFFQTFLAAQVATGVRGFLSKSITVAAMHQQSGDIHHIVPKDYLQKNGFPDRADYNQVANFALTETSINISIGNKPPTQYMCEVAAQIDSGQLTLGENHGSSGPRTKPCRKRRADPSGDCDSRFLSGVSCGTQETHRRRDSELLRSAVRLPRQKKPFDEDLPTMYF